jgi:aryl-alcohol dehydrogenase-like predicted oxidoreductase
VESLWVSERLGLNRFVCEQPPYNLLDRRIERELIPMAQTYGFGLIPWSPLGGGLLTGKDTRDEPPPPDSRFGNMANNPMQQRRWTQEVFDVVDGVAEIAQAKECTVSQFALAWVMQQPAVSSPIIGPRTMEQLEDNLGALRLTITEEDRAAVDALIPPGRMASPFYEADFGPHQYRV